MARAALRISFTRAVAAGLILGAGGFAANAEPIPIAPPPISVAEPRPDPNLPVLPTLGSFPTLPVPALPAVPELPKIAEIPQPAQPVIPALPTLPVPSLNPENTLRPALPPLNLIPAAPVLPTPLAPEAIPVAGEVVRPPRKIGDEVLVPPMPVKIPAEGKTPGPLTIAPPLPAPGEPPMLSLKKLTLSTTMGVALAFAPTNAIRAEDPKPMPTPAEIKAIETALKKEIGDLKDELKKSKEVVGMLDLQVMGRQDGKGLTLTDDGLLKRMEKLEKAMKEIDTKLVTMNEMLAKRTVGSSPLDGGKTAAGMGKVKVVNEFSTKISIMVNEKSYPIDPAQTKEIEVPMGNFSYLLIADGTTKTTSAIKEGETVTLRIR